MRKSIMAAVLAAGAGLFGFAAEARPYEDPPPRAARGSAPDENGFAYRYRGGNPNRDRVDAARAERPVAVSPYAARARETHRCRIARLQARSGYGRTPYVTGAGRVFGAYGRPYWRNVAYAPALVVPRHARRRGFDCY